MNKVGEVVWIDKFKNEIGPYGSGNIFDFYIVESSYFNTIDGFIDYSMLLIDYFQNYIKTKSSELNNYYSKIKSYLNCLKNKEVEFDENLESYDDYREKISKLFENINQPEEFSNLGDFETVDNFKNILSNISKDKNKSYLIFFGIEKYLEDSGKPKELKVLTYETIVNQYMHMRLSNNKQMVKLENSEIIYNMSKYGCHIEVIVTINLLMDTLRYLSVVGLDDDGKMFDFDTFKIEGNLKVAEETLKRIKLIK